MRIYLVYPENPIGVEIIELIGVGFSGDACTVTAVYAVRSRVFPES